MRQYTDEQVAAMRTAFEKVEDKSNWKNPINKIVKLTDEEKHLTGDAIVFYCGCIAEFIPLPTTGWYHVKAIGYYQAVGA